MAAPGARAGSVTIVAGPGLSDPAASNPFQNNQGGEFTLISPELGIPMGYSPAATLTIAGTPGFESFCIDFDEEFIPDFAYSYTVSDLVGGSRPLAAGAAWLYREFATGDLAGYHYTDAPAGSRNSDAGRLQDALWWLMDQGGVGFDPTNPFMAAAVDHFTMNGALDFADASAAAMAPAPAGFESVEVLNLFVSDPGGQVLALGQDQLIYLPPSAVADSGTTALALAATGSCLFAVSRRRRADLTSP